MPLACFVNKNLNINNHYLFYKNLEKVKLEITANAQESGALFGSVGVSEILSALHEKGLDFLNKSNIILSTGPIKEVGEFEVNVELHPEIVKSISIEVKST